MSLPALIRIDGSEKILIDRPTVMIGRSHRRADFLIDDPTVSAVHCELHVDQTGLTVRDMSRHGTLVNGRKVDHATLHEGDILEIVGHRFHVTFQGAEAPQKALVEDVWFVRLAGVELGPMPWEELTGMVQRRELQAQDFVRSVTENEWKPAAELKQLFAPPETEEMESTEADDAAEHQSPQSAPVAQASVDTASEAEETKVLPVAQTGRADADPVVPAPASPAPEPPKESELEDSPPPVFANEAAAVINIDELAENEVAAMTDESSAKPRFTLDDSETDPRDPLGDTMVSAQAKTVSEPQAFTEEKVPLDEAQAVDDEPSDDTSGDVSPIGDSAGASATEQTVWIDAEKLPGSGWMYRHGDAEFGPIDLDGLSELAMAELLLPDDPVQLPGTKHWVPAEQIPGVFAARRAADEILHDPLYDASSLSDLEMDLEEGPSAGDGQPFGQPSSAAATAAQPNLGEAMVIPPPPRAESRGGSSSLEKLASPVTFVLGHVLAHPRVSTGIVVAALAVWLLLPGADQHAAYVSGKIELDGQPLRNATITFMEPEAGWGATANLDGDGRFEVTTLRGGLRPGNYLISLMPEKPEPALVVKELQRQYQQRYGGGSTAALPVGTLPRTNGSNRIKPGEDPIILPRGTIPIQFRSTETSGLTAKIENGANDVSFSIASK